MSVYPHFAKTLNSSDYERTKKFSHNILDPDCPFLKSEMYLSMLEKHTLSWPCRTVLGWFINPQFSSVKSASGFNI